MRTCNTGRQTLSDQIPQARALRAGPGAFVDHGLTKSYRRPRSTRLQLGSGGRGTSSVLWVPTAAVNHAAQDPRRSPFSDYQGTVTINGHAPASPLKAIVSTRPPRRLLNTD